MIYDKYKVYSYVKTNIKYIALKREFRNLNCANF